MNDRMAMPTQDEMRRRQFEITLFRTLEAWTKARNLLAEPDELRDLMGVIMNMRDLFNSEVGERLRLLEKANLEHALASDFHAA